MADVQLDHVRVLLAEPSRCLLGLLLERRQLALQLLDERVGQDLRRRVEPGPIRRRRLELPVHRLLGQPLGFRARDRRVQIRELLHGDVVAVHERDGLVLLPVALQPGFGGFDFLALLGEPRAEPVVRLLRRHEPVLEVLLDVVPGQRVDDARRQRRIRMPILDVHQPAVADGRDRQL